MQFDNRNPKQLHFNQIKGTLHEVNNSKFSSITILCGKENARTVNLSVKKDAIEDIEKKHAIGDKVNCKYYLVSNKKEGKWYTNAILLSIEFELN